MTSLKPNTIYFGGLHIAQDRGTEGFLLAGAPGSGKSHLLQLMAKTILPGIRLGTNRRAIFYDAKRDAYPILLGMGVPEDRIKILHPFDQRCYAWDMAKDIRDPATAVEIGTLLVPQKSGEMQPFFPEAARSLIGGVMEVFLQTAPQMWKLRDVVLTLRSYERLKTVLSKVDSTRHLVDKFLGGTDTSRDIAATIENTMRRLSFVAAAWQHTGDRSISLERWIREESILLLGSSPTLESTLVQVNQAILHRASQIILNQPEANRQEIPPQNWLFIDELRRAGRLEHLPGFLVEGRSKGLCFVGAYQDLPGMYEVFGEKLTKEVVGTPQNIGFLWSTEVDTQKFASEVFGTQEVELTRYGFNWGGSKSFSSRESTTSTQDGGSVSRFIHSRPVINHVQFKMLPQPNRKTGIHGYFYVPCIGSAYRGHVCGEFVEENRVRPHPSEPEVLHRPPEHQYLHDWTSEDLTRLGLSAHPELLNAGKASDSKPKSKSNDKKKNSHSKTETAETELSDLLPKRSL